MYLFFRDENLYRVKLWDCLTNGIYDKEFLSSIYIERADLLRWCEKRANTTSAFLGSRN